MGERDRNLGNETPQQSDLEESDRTFELPLDLSIGYRIRATHRALQRYLQTKIAPFGVTLGMWYFLRVLWEEDGLTQRELSQRVGTMEPTTLTALQAMERSGLVERVRNSEDRRKVNIYLTRKGRGLKRVLLPLVRDIVNRALTGFSAREITTMLDLLKQIEANLEGIEPDFDFEDEAH
jgi:DNA-binding MarR family transcriptional regulator